MRKILLLLLILPFALFLFGNEPDGSYKNQNDSVYFSGDKIIFSLSGFGALSNKMVGEGTFEINDRYLIINTGEYSGSKSTINTQPTQSNKTVSISFLNDDGFALPGVLVELLSSSNKIIQRAVSDEMGRIDKSFNEKFNNVKVSLMGYDGLDFRYDNSLDYTINMIKNKVIENKVVLFEIKPDGEDSITLTLLSEDFKAGKDLKKALEKSYQKALKTNRLGKRFKKEYISVFYNR